MSPQPHIAHQPHQRAAVIRLIFPRPELTTHLAFALTELLNTLANQRLAPTGPLFAHYLRITPTLFDLEVGLPTPSPVRAFGRVDPGQLPACTVARTLHQGAWSTLPDAWQDFDRWLASESRHTPATDLWELFHTTPGTVLDPTLHRTELLRRVRPGMSPVSATPEPLRQQRAGNGRLPPQTL